MFAEIFAHVPVWVWLVFAGLIALGVSQLSEQRRSLRKAVRMSVLMAGVSLYGVASAFPGEPVALAAWALAVVAVLALTNAFNAWSGVRWSSTERCLVVPGSWTPLVLFLSLFIIKFGVGMMIGMHPEYRQLDRFAMLVGLCYGAFSGTFLSRGIAMWRVARDAGATLAAY